MLLKTSSPCESLPMPSPALSLFVLDEVVKGIQKNLRHMSKSKYIMNKEKIILCYAFLVQILTVCQIEDKCQKEELIKWILFKKKQFLYLFYLTVQCQITESCSYIIIISKKNEVVIEHMGVFNYYISEKIRNMNFKFKNDFIIYYI